MRGIAVVLAPDMARERVTSILYRGKSVLLLDIAAGTSAEMLEVIALATPRIRSAKPSSVLTLTDVTNVDVKAVPINELVEFVKGNKPYVKGAAVVGVSDLAGAILATTRILTGRQLKAFDTRQQALDWLTSLA